MAIRFEWADGKGSDFYLTDEYVEIEPEPRIAHVERMALPNAATRAMMLATGMADGMEVSYQRLEATVGEWA